MSISDGNSSASKRDIIRDGLHTTEALSALSVEIKTPESLHVIAERAATILGYAVDPIAGPAGSYGLLYGLIQSGKTSVITVTTAMAADNGFKCIVILTSDLNPLYTQTLRRVKSQLRGLKVFGKSDWDDPAFERQIRTSPFVVVCSKNGDHLTSLLEAFRKVGASAGAKGLPTLIIDDEADQASLNTKNQKNAKKKTNDASSINGLITDYRKFFQTNTYLQVTATPQALFLQVPDGLYRPSFTVLSVPGPGYVGGEAFFGEKSKLLSLVDLDEVDQLKSGHQPAPTMAIPDGLRGALHSFFVAAAAKNMQYPDENFSFLCHISHTKIDHERLTGLIDAYREAAVNAFANQASPAFQKLKGALQDAYDNLRETDPGLPQFDDVLKRIQFLLPAASIKEINSNSDEEVVPDHPYSIFVGGNKLGRGVTIPNLITSYYGRNPKRPNSDTVLQHARMYGYRQQHIGVTRLFLPEKLADHFRIIHQMEEALRALIEKHPEGKFEGICLEAPIQATRRNVLDPNAIGVYVAGGWVNPRYPLRTKETLEATKWIDNKLAVFDGTKPYYETDIPTVIELIQKCKADPAHGSELWNIKTVGAALEKMRTWHKTNKAHIRVSRDRALETPRRETAGFYSGGEEKLVPDDAVTLFMFRVPKSAGGEAVWLPQVRFPDGNYAIAFSFEK